MTKFQSTSEKILSAQEASLSEDIVLQSLEECRLATQKAFEIAKINIHLFCQNFEPRIYDNNSLINLTSELLRLQRNSRVKILVQDGKQLVKNGHRFVELSQRLSSKFEIRKIHHDFSTLTQSFLIVDSKCLIYRPHFERFEGTINFAAPRSCDDKEKLFQSIWEKSEPDSELRRLHL
ncbi:MAG: hypothetical protein AAGB12_13445 [Pseudomonadota bacterium]